MNKREEKEVNLLGDMLGEIFGIIKKNTASLKPEFTFNTHTLKRPGHDTVGRAMLTPLEGVLHPLYIERNLETGDYVIRICMASVFIPTEHDLIMHVPRKHIGQMAYWYRAEEAREGKAALDKILREESSSHRKSKVGLFFHEALHGDLARSVATCFCDVEDRPVFPKEKQAAVLKHECKN